MANWLKGRKGDSMQVLVLAAGKSTRINSSITKMMHEIRKIRILRRVLENLEKSGLQDIYLILGHQLEILRREFSNYKFFTQAEQLGTGDAVKSAFGLNNSEDTLIVFGDKPLFRPETLKDFLDKYKESKCLIGVSTVQHPAPERYSEGYGTVVRENGKLVALRKNEGEVECDGGLYVFNTTWLWKNISKLSSKDNGRGKQEYFLPDLVEVGTSQGFEIFEYKIKDYREAIGINTPEQFMEAELYLTDLTS